LVPSLAHTQLAAGFATGLALQETPDLFFSGAAVWVVLLAVVGGAIGALYNLLIIVVNKWRTRLFIKVGGVRHRRPSELSEGSEVKERSLGRKGSLTQANMKRFKLVQTMKVTEALCISCIIFSVYFLVPLTLSCTDCPPNTTSLGLNESHRRLAAAADGSDGGCVYTGHRPHVRHT
jgi:hypothetical protein